MIETQHDLDSNEPVVGSDILSRTFPMMTRNELLHDDHVAFSSVCAVLIAIVSGGLLIGLLGVLFSL